MEPTIDNQKCYLLVKVGFLLPKNFEKGDVVIAENPNEDAKDDIVKRVIGLPGDVVIRHPRAWKSDNDWLLSKYLIPDGKVWLQGDNMSHSVDSRTYGTISKEAIYGKVVCQLYPNFKWMDKTMEHAGQEQKYFDLKKNERPEIEVPEENDE